MIADGALLDCLRRVAAFGLHLVRLDIRQDAARHAAALEIARWPESIKGYGHVKARHLAAARQRQQALMAAWRSPAAARRVA